MKLFEAIGAEYSCVPVRNTCWHAGQPAMRLDDSHSSGAFVWCHNGTPVEFQAAWLTDDTWERVEDRPEADVPEHYELIPDGETVPVGYKFKYSLTGKWVTGIGFDIGKTIPLSTPYARPIVGTWEWAIAQKPEGPIRCAIWLDKELHMRLIDGAWKWYTWVAGDAVPPSPCNVTSGTLNDIRKRTDWQIYTPIANCNSASDSADNAEGKIVPTRKELKAAMKEARADLLDELYDYHQSDEWCNAPLAVRIYYKVYRDSCSQLEDAE